MPINKGQFNNRMRQITGICADMDKEQLIDVARRLGVVDFILETEDYLSKREKDHLSEVEIRKQEVLDALYNSATVDRNAVAAEKYLTYYKDVGGSETDEHIVLNITPFIIQDTVRYAPVEG